VGVIEEPRQRTRGEHVTAAVACPAVRQPEDFTDARGLPKRRVYALKHRVTLDLDPIALIDLSLNINLIIEGTLDPSGSSGWQQLARTDSWHGGKTGRDGRPRPPMLGYSAASARWQRIRVRFETNKRVNAGVSYEASERAAVYDRHHSIAFDDDSSSEGTGSSVTWSHTCSGSDRALYVAAYTFEGSGANDTSVTATYNSVAMTKRSTVADASVPQNQQFCVLRLVAPATGANNIVVTEDGPNDEIDCAAMSYTGVDQTTPDEGFQTNAGDGIDPSATVSSASGDVVAGFVTWYNATTSVGADQTERVFNDNGVSFNSLKGSDEPGAASVTHSYTSDVTTWIAMIAWNMNAAVAAGGTNPKGPLGMPMRGPLQRVVGP
jgi:hypothetical protein